MTNSRKSQSEKLATGGGRETTAVKPDNKLGPRPAPLTGRLGPGPGEAHLHEAQRLLAEGEAAPELASRSLVYHVAVHILSHSLRQPFSP